MTGDASALTLNARANGLSLNIEASDLTLDAGRAPFALLHITIPYTPTLASALDPRLDFRVTGQLRQDFTTSQVLANISAAFPGGTLANISAAFSGGTLATISATFGRSIMPGRAIRTGRVVPFDLALRGREVRADDGVIILTAASDELLLQDYSLLAGASMTPGALTVDAALAMAFRQALPGQAIDTTAVAGAPIDGSAAVWMPGESAWTYLTSLLTPYGFRLWCDERRVWHVGPVDEWVIATPWDLYDTVNLKDVSDAVDRDLEWYDAVIVVYTWTDASNIRHVSYDYASDGSPSKVLTVNVDRPYPGAGEAAARLRKLLTRGHQVQVDVSPDLTPYPSQFMEVHLTGATNLAGYTERITWSLPTDAMVVTASDIHEV